MTRLPTIPMRHCAAALLLALLAGCVPPATAPVVAPPPVTAAPVPVDPSGIESEATIAASVAATPGLHTLAGEVRTAELDALLGGDGPYTLFAPTDAAFTRLAPGIASDLLAPENRTALVAMLRYHIVPGVLTTEQLTQRIRDGGGRAMLTTLGGQPITATLTGDVITLTSATGNRSYVEAADVAQANGVIHIVNGVLVPNLGQ
ncbi:fasciclin domain-containing protein [Sphingomonas sp. RP10(2022)]|uniref:Fasciclin domain-containing protein n=1 Tax=Sphingomonas liriopis TaxID=2949094 RepID=A0A9X2KQB8_9SPHN|nr:fasciclin domain-containing protein [Sphingomonas liriopis]MCP3734772.1 fasciclin domain-containing protein [Sphingomonas liriopis]